MTNEIRGQKELVSYLEGNTLTPHGAIEAKCFLCTDGYSKGKRDCKRTDCPLYPWMPYRNDSY